jgi:hypothetical protein
MIASNGCDARTKKAELPSAPFKEVFGNIAAVDAYQYSLFSLTEKRYIYCIKFDKKSQI